MRDPTLPTPAECRQCTAYGLAVCSALEPDELDVLEQHAHQTRLAAGGVLARSGDPCLHAYSVTGGMLRLVRSLADGRRQVVDFMLAGDFIGLSQAQHYRYDIEAVIDSSTCIFDMDSIAALRLRYPALEQKMLQRACETLDGAQDAMLMLARMSPAERLAAFLLRMRRRYIANGVHDSAIVLPMGRADIADHLGLTIETVSRSFSKLRNDGLIALPGPHRVNVLDEASLMGLAQHRP